MSSPEHSTIFEAPLRRFRPPCNRCRDRRATCVRPRARSRPPRSRSPTQEFKPAYSPIVLAGTVRLIEAALVIAGRLCGLCLRMWCRRYGFAWYYVAAIVGIALLAMLAFQAADIYQVQAFRGHEKQYMRLASAWSVVFLIAIGVSFFAKAGDQFSRAWLGAFYVLGLFTLIAFRRGAVPAGAPLDAARAGSTAAPSWSAPTSTAKR